MQIIELLTTQGASVEYADPFVPTLACAAPTLTAITDPAAHDWDLVIVHTRHLDRDLGWVPATTEVLDPTHQ